MQRLRTVAVVGSLLAIVIAPLAYAGGLWFGLPVVGGAAYCAGATATGLGTTGGTVSCNSTAPAGPTSLTGNELVPSDLNPQGAQSTYPAPGQANAGAQTAYIPEAAVASGAYFLTTNNGIATLTALVPNGINNVILNATGTITDYALLLPITPTDGQIVRFASNATITAVHVTSTGPNVGATVVSVDTPTKVFSPVVPQPSTTLAITSVTIGGFSYLYNLSGNRWFRLQ